MKVGMDVSTWQRTIDYSKAKSVVQFVIPRTGFALTTDNTFRQNVKNALSNGVEVPAVYHFSYALSIQDAIAEAQYAISEVKTAGLPKTTIIFYDFEYDSVNYAKKKGVAIGPKEVNNFTTAFCEECKKQGYQTGIYLNLDYYKNYYYDFVLKKYTIWLADWTGGPDKPCYIQQYTSKGSVPGVNGNVDMNYIFDTAPSTKLKDVHEVALEVLGGKWGNGPDRKMKLENAGYDYNAVQAEVNTILNGTAVTEENNTHKGVAAAGKHDRAEIATYKTTEEVYLRQGPGKNKYAICKLPKDIEVYCCGYYDIANESRWLYVHCVPFGDNVIYNGFVCKDYLKRV